MNDTDPAENISPPVAFIACTCKLNLVFLLAGTYRYITGIIVVAGAMGLTQQEFKDESVVDEMSGAVNQIRELTVRDIAYISQLGTQELPTEEFFVDLLIRVTDRNENQPSVSIGTLTEN